MSNERQDEERVSGASSGEAGGLEGLLGKVLEVGQGLFGAVFGALRGGQQSSGTSLSEQGQGGLPDLPGAVGDVLNEARNSLTGGWQELTRQIGSLPENLGRGDTQASENPAPIGPGFSQIDLSRGPGAAPAAPDLPEGSWSAGVLGDLSRAGQSLAAGSSALPSADSVPQSDAGFGGLAADLGRASHDHDLGASAAPNASAGLPTSNLHKEKS